MRVFAALGSDSARVHKVPDLDGNNTVAEVISMKIDHECFMFLQTNVQYTVRTSRQGLPSH
jgi:hypothetical protein